MSKIVKEKFTETPRQRYPNDRKEKNTHNDGRTQDKD